MRVILIIAALAAFLYVGLCLVLFLSQRSFIYYPQPKSPTDHDPTLTLDVNGARIVIATRPSTGPDAVIYFGGNAEAVSYSLPTLAEAYRGRSLFAMNYRGYGGSTGTPSEAALIADALVLFDHVHVDHPHIIVIGRSLGSGVAVHIASLRPVERLVLVTPYDSLAEIAANHFRLFPVRWLLIDKFESWRYVPKISAPTQLIAAQYDDVIPFLSTQSLYKHFPEGLATLTVIPMVGHNSISESPDYIPLLRGTHAE
jgi:pimeloyl-ACP methyl ester carboxylesterase